MIESSSLESPESALSQKWTGWGPGVVLIEAAVIRTVAMLILPVAIGRSVDAILEGRSSAWVVVTLSMVVLGIAGEVGAVWAGGVMAARRSALRTTVLVSHALRTGPRLTWRMPVGEAVVRSTSNAAQASTAPLLWIALFASSLPALGATAALLWIDVWCGITFAVALLVLVALLKSVARQTAQLSEPYLLAQAQIAGSLAESLVGARTVGASGTEAAERARVLAPLPQLGVHGRAMWRLQAVAGARAGILMPTLAFLVIAVAGWQLTAGRLTIGEMTSVVGYVMLGNQVLAALGAVTGLAQARVAGRRCAELTDVPAIPYGDSAPVARSGAIRFVEVHANLAGVPSLRGVDVLIPAGQHVALVGADDSGASLLPAVLGRLVEPDVGAVLLDGVLLPELSAEALHGAVGFAFARPALVGHTVAGTIALGEARPEPGMVVAAARDARADDFISRLPLGYLTPLVDAPMSGGEAQRLGLARAFAHPGDVLVFDDATSSLDTVTEHQVMQALTAGRRRTRLVVTRRVSSAVQADRVLWFAEGRIRGDGTHAELWQNPAYRAVFGAAESESAL